VQSDAWKTCLDQKSLELTRDVARIKRRANGVRENESAIAPLAAGGEPSFELAHAMCPEGGHGHGRQRDRASTARRLWFRDLNRGLYLGKRRAQLFQLLNQFGALRRGFVCFRRSLQRCSQPLALSDQLAARPCIASETLHGPTHL